MSRILEIALVVLLGQTTPPQQPASPSGAALSGVIAIAGSNEPIAGAGVELSRVAPANRAAGPPVPFGAPANAYTVESNDEGKFTLNNIPPGDYHLAAARAGFVRSEYGQRGFDDSGRIITLSAGQTLTDVRVALTKTSSLAGRITDRNGDSFPNVQVQAMKYVYEDGRRVLSTAKAMVTDDLGEYRLFWLQPGDYVVMAKPLRGAVNDMLMMPMANGGLASRPILSPTGALILAPEDSASVPFYFPGSADARSATELHLKPGDDLGSINFTIRGVNAHHVRGAIANLPPNLPVPVGEGGTAFLSMRVRLAPRAESAFDDESTPFGPGTSIDRKTGAFDIPGVIPGSYLLIATIQNEGRGAEPINLYAQIPLEVGNDDINNLSLQVEPGFDVPVRISIDGSPGAAAPDLAGLQIRFNGYNSRGAEPAQGAPAGQYVFRLMRIDTGLVIVEGLADDQYIKSIQMGDTNVLKEPVRIDRASSVPIEIVIGRPGGVVSGIVVEDSSNAVPNATVVLVPDEPNRKRADLYRKTTADSSGKFRLTGIAPGDYSIFVWDSVPKGAWQNSEFMQAFNGRGKPVHIDEGSAVDAAAMSPLK